MGKFNKLLAEKEQNRRCPLSIFHGSGLARGHSWKYPLRAGLASPGYLRTLSGWKIPHWVSVLSLSPAGFPLFGLKPAEQLGPHSWDVPRLPPSWEGLKATASAGLSSSSFSLLGLCSLTSPLQQEADRDF